MLKNVSVHDLVPGMFVNKVVEQEGQLRVRSSGIVKTANAIGKLKEMGILTVEVDYNRSHIDSPAETQTQVDSEQSQKPKQTNSQALSEASNLYQEAVSIHSEMMQTLKSGAANDLSQASELSSSIIESVFDNQDAMSCLTMIKNTDHYLLEHSINCSILMAMFANHLGYDRDTIDQACMGALLMDIGMSTVPEDLRYQSTPPSAGDWEVIRSHVEIGVDMVSRYDDISDLALTVIRQHHERLDGSGYPEGLLEPDISLFARMAAIVDTYDAMISHRPYRENISATLALKRLTKQPGLDQSLVKQFVRCVGVHPVGSLVKLKSGRLGIISRQSTNDLLSPVVMTFYSVNAGHYSEIKRVDLTKSDDEIVSGVRPDDFGINLPKFFRDVFVHNVPD